MKRRHKMRTQRLCGLLLLLVSFFIVVLTAYGSSPADRDGTVILLTVPLGLYMLITNKIVIS